MSITCIFFCKFTAGGRFEVDKKTGEVRVIESEYTGFQMLLEYVIYVKAEDADGNTSEEERLSLVGGRRYPSFSEQHYNITVYENASVGSE